MPSELPLDIMKTLIALLLAGACSALWAQTPANNPMPDGSRDLYVGLGVVSEPSYLGGAERRVRALPLLQLEWSNGVFVSALSAGMHLSGSPGVEYGPLLALHSRRSECGAGPGAGAVTPAIPGILRPTTRAQEGGNALAGMDEIGARLQAGMFFNYYLSPGLRLTNSVLVGAGKERDGVLWNLGLQQSAPDITAHQRLSFGAGLTLVNRNYNSSYSGVSAAEAKTSGHPEYGAGAGVRDVYLAAGWNWALSPSWMLASGARVTRLQGDARHSPLVQRPTNVVITTGLAYRF